jgi:hypothetical protein
VNAPVEAPDGFSECGVETLDARTAKRRDDVAIAALVAGMDE